MSEISIRIINDALVAIVDGKEGPDAFLSLSAPEFLEALEKTTRTLEAKMRKARTQYDRFKFSDVILPHRRHDVFNLARRYEGDIHRRITESVEAFRL